MRITTILVYLTFLSISFITLQADDITGEMVYANKLKHTCNVKGNIFAKKHTQLEWKKLFESGKLYEEIKNNCENIEPIKKEHLEHLYKFFYKYAKDTNIDPLC